MKKLWIGGGGLLALLLALPVFAGFTTTDDKMTVIADEGFALQRPSKEWDIQKVRKDPHSPFKLVLHKAGSNPTIQLRYTELTREKGRNLNQLAQYLKKDYRLQGVLIEQVEKKTIDGQPLYLLHGFNPYKEERHLIGIWAANQQGYVLECTSAKDDFHAMKAEFQKAIETARILKK